MRTAGLGVDVKGLDGASDWHNRPNVETAPDEVGEWQITTLVVSGTEWALPFQYGSNYRRNILLRSQGGGHQQEVRQLEDWQTYGAFNAGVGLGLRTVVNNVPEGWFQGEIAEVLIYNRALSSEEQTQVEVYLTSRHALPSQTASLDLSSDFRYTGHYYHRKSGLHLAPYRAYDAEMAVWLSEDPIQEEGGINLYGYVGNSPLMAVDPLGLVDWCPGAEPYKADLLKTQFGRDLLAALQAAEKRAKQTITVQTHDAPSKFYQGTNVIALSNNAESYPTAGGSPVLFQPGQLLAHEMKHAFDHLNGELGKFILDKKGPFPPCKSCPNRAEFRAMETENVWIQSLNELNKNLKGWNPLPLRGYY